MFPKAVKPYQPPFGDVKVHLCTKKNLSYDLVLMFVRYSVRTSPSNVMLKKFFDMNGDPLNISKEKFIEKIRVNYHSVSSVSL